LGKNKKKEILINKTELNRKKKRKGKINKKKGKKEIYNSHFVLLFVNLWSDLNNQTTCLLQAEIVTW